MILDANDPTAVPDEILADLVIIGAGTAGLFLADYLCANGDDRRILILESGGRVADTRSNALTATGIGKRHDGVQIGRASGLGGTSCLWGGQLAEFDPADLSREDAPWPFGYTELRTHYEKVYRHFDISTKVTDEYCRLALGGETQRTLDAERFFTRWLKEPNFARLFDKMITKSAQIRIILNTTAVGIDMEGEKVIAVRSRSVQGRSIRARAGEFVFATGTIATNRFFLSTGRRDPVPWKGNTNLGLYFQDHLGGPVGTVELTDETRFRDLFENGWVDGVKVQPKIRLVDHARIGQDTGVCGSFSYDSDVSQNIGRLKEAVRGVRSRLSFSTSRTLACDAWNAGASVLPIIKRYVSSRRVLAFFDKGLTFNVQSEQIPTANSRISIASLELLRDGLYPVAVDWRCDGNEAKSIRRLLNAADEYLRGLNIGRLRVDPSISEGSDDSLVARLGDTYHQCGGLRMTASRHSGGIVDADNRVWGTSNVWVASAATFPSSSHANCTLTLLALCTRLGDLLRRRSARLPSTDVRTGPSPVEPVC
jgi:choline dehydrogenase-like flavoprotein